MDKQKQIIEVVAYNPQWKKVFEEEAVKLKTIFADNLVQIHHIGSTAVPGMAAKPTIDILIEVKDINLADQCIKKMTEIGYECWGEYNVPGRRFFLKGEEKRTHHVHTFQTGNPNITMHLHYRDYLITHPEVAKEYAKLKIQLAEKFVNDRLGYVKSKMDFVDDINVKAKEYFSKKNGA